MPIMIAAVALVGGLCLLDLLLTFGVIRRLREQANLLSGAGRTGPEVIGLEAGQAPGPFSALSIDGSLVNGVAGLRVVAFLSSSCSACPGRVPPFLDYLTDHRIERDSVLAVVQGAASAPPPYLDRVAGMARVCIEPDGGEIGRAFNVTGFPAFCLLDADGAVVVSGFDPSVLPAPAAA
jgi:hypothetical protein